MKKDYLRPEHAQEVTAMLSPKHPIIKPVIERFVSGYLKAFNGDAAEIRSICQGSVIKAVRAYSGKKARKACQCKDPNCSVVARAAVRIMRNDLYNALEASHAQKRGGGCVLTPIAEMDTEGHDDGERQWTPVRSGTAHSPMIQRAIASYHASNPLQRMINLQMAAQIRDAERRLTVPQAAVFRLAVNPSRAVYLSAQQLEAKGVKAPFVVAAQQSVKASDLDAAVVKSAILEILSL